MIGFATGKTQVTMHGALVDLEPDATAPRYPRSHVVLPFLVNQRKGVRRERNIEFARAGGRHLRLDVTHPVRPRSRPVAPFARP